MKMIKLVMRWRFVDGIDLLEHHRENVRPIGLRVAVGEPHFIAGAVVEALFTVYNNISSSIKIDSRVAKALRKI